MEPASNELGAQQENAINRAEMIFSDGQTANEIILQSQTS